MHRAIFGLVKVQLRGILRDRVFHAVLGVAIAMILMVPVLSSFSMRQVQELAISLSLSTVSTVLLVLTLLLGASSVWRDVDRRYSTSILTLPISRSQYLLSKYFGIVLFQAVTLVVLGIGAAIIIKVAASVYPSELPIPWTNILLVLVSNLFKYQLLLGVALLLSTVSTSFYLPFFVSLALYLCGNASQEVLDFVNSPVGVQLHPVSAKAVMLLYYLLPNLGAFDFQVHAVYSLPVPFEGFLLSIGYAVIYTGILLGLAIFAFNRRELP